MNDLEQKFNKWRQVRLDGPQKHFIKANLVAFMHAHPVPAAITAHAFFIKRLLPVGFAVFVIIVGGGSSLAAERSAPGDALYALKVNFNEPLIGALNFSVDAKASWQTELVERRLTEANQLALSGELSAANEITIEKGLQSSAKNAEKEIEALKKSGQTGAAQNISSKLESSLKAHDQILAELSPNKSMEAGAAASMSLRATPKDAMTPPSDPAAVPHEKIRAQIRETLQNISKVRGETEGKLSEDNRGAAAMKAANVKINLAGKAIEEMSAYLQKNAEILGPENLTAARAKLETASKLLQAANLKMGEKN